MLYSNGTEHLNRPVSSPVIDLKPFHEYQFTFAELPKTSYRSALLSNNLENNHNQRWIDTTARVAIEIAGALFRKPTRCHVLCLSTFAVMCAYHHPLVFYRRCCLRLVDISSLPLIMDMKMGPPCRYSSTLCSACILGYSISIHLIYNLRTISNLVKNRWVY